MLKLSTTTRQLHPRRFYFMLSEIFLYFLHHWQSGREQQRKSICLQSLNVITLHVCTLSPTLLGSSTRRSLLSAHCSLRIWFCGSWSLGRISFISSRMVLKEFYFGRQLCPWILVKVLMCHHRNSRWKRKVSCWLHFFFFFFQVILEFWILGSRGRWGSWASPTPSSTPPHLT